MRKGFPSPKECLQLPYGGTAAEFIRGLAKCKTGNPNAKVLKWDLVGASICGCESGPGSVSHLWHECVCGTWPLGSHRGS